MEAPLIHLPVAGPAADPPTVLHAADRQGLLGDSVKCAERWREGPSLRGWAPAGGEAGSSSARVFTQSPQTFSISDLQIENH